MKIDNLTLGFENCDFVTISGKYICSFLVDDIRTSFQRIACNSIEKIDVAYTFVVGIHKDADVKYNQFGLEDFEATVFNRICGGSDITSIEFDLIRQYEEDAPTTNEPRTEHYRYLIEWSGECENKNTEQKTYISKCDSLYLVIDKNKGVEDFFDMEEINDKDTMDIVFEMCDIGDRKTACFEENDIHVYEE
ncbi:MAG: hypothetical protein RR365_08580 [Bacteroides sp.]